MPVVRASHLATAAAAEPVASSDIAELGCVSVQGVRWMFPVIGFMGPCFAVVQWLSHRPFG